MSKDKRKMAEEIVQDLKDLINFHKSIVNIPFDELSKRLKSKSVAYNLLMESYQELGEYAAYLDKVPEVPADLEQVEYRTVVINSGEKKTEVDRYDLLSLVTMHSEEELMELFGFKTKEALRDALEMADDLLYIY